MCFSWVERETRRKAKPIWEGGGNICFEGADSFLLRGKPPLGLVCRETPCFFEATPYIYIYIYIWGGGGVKGNQKKAIIDLLFLEGTPPPFFLSAAESYGFGQGRVPEGCGGFQGSGAAES